MGPRLRYRHRQWLQYSQNPRIHIQGQRSHPKSPRQRPRHPHWARIQIFRHRLRPILQPSQHTMQQRNIQTPSVPRQTRIPHHRAPHQHEQPGASPQRQTQRNRRHLPHRTGHLDRLRRCLRGPPLLRPQRAQPERPRHLDFQLG